MYLHSAAATQFTITHSIAPVQVASVQSSCYNDYSTPNGLGATAEWMSPNTSDGFPKTDTPSSARRRQSEPRSCIRSRRGCSRDICGQHRLGWSHPYL